MRHFVAEGEADVAKLGERVAGFVFKCFLADAALVVRFQADEDFAFRHFAAAAGGGEDVRHFVVLAQGLFDFAHVGVGLLQGAGRRQLHVDLAHADVAFGHEAGGQQRKQHHRAGK